MPGIFSQGHFWNGNPGSFLGSLLNCFILSNCHTKRHFNLHVQFYPNCRQMNIPHCMGSFVLLHSYATGCGSRRLSGACPDVRLDHSLLHIPRDSSRKCCVSPCGNSRRGARRCVSAVGREPFPLLMPQRMPGAQVSEAVGGTRALPEPRVRLSRGLNQIAGK